MSVLSLGSAEMELLPPILHEYAAQKIAVDGLSEKTVCEYLMDLRTFFRFTEAKRLKLSLTDTDFTKIDISHIDEEYVKSIKPITINEFLLYTKQERSNDWASRSRKLSSLKNFFKYLKLRKHIIETNPTDDLSSAKKHYSLPKYLSLEESIKLLETVKNDGESKTVTRDFCIITLFLNCGMRLSELVGIDLNRIDPKLTSLRVIGKGSKERIVYLNDACRSAIVDYLRERTSMQAQQGHANALFLSLRGQRISNKTVQWMVYKYLKLAGLDYKGYSVHKLRHTAATLMYQSGKVDVRVLKDILGHSQLNTTQIYTHLSDENMSKAMNDNPLSEIKIKRKITDKD